MLRPADLGLARFVHTRGPYSKVILKNEHGPTFAAKELTYFTLAPTLFKPQRAKELAAVNFICSGAVIFSHATSSVNDYYNARLRSSESLSAAELQVGAYSSVTKGAHVPTWSSKR